MKGNAGDVVTLTTASGGWTQGADQNVNGVAYHYYAGNTADAVAAYIDATVTVIIS